MKDILNPNLSGEKRLQTAAPDLRRIFRSDLYDIFLCRFPGLITALIHDKKERLRIMTRLWDEDDPGQSANPGALTKDAWIQAAVSRLRTEGRGPLHLIRDAKLECNLPLSLHDRAALKIAGIEVPRSAGRYREMFNP